MGVKAPPLYGENEKAYAKEALKAVEAAKAAIAEGHKEKALSAIEYAIRCNTDLLTVIEKEKDVD